jgi:hypothetical protein
VKNLGLHDVRMRQKLKNEINSIYAKIHELEQKIKALENTKPIAQ